MRKTTLAVVLLATILTAGCGTAQTVVDDKEASDVLQIAVTTAVAYGVTHNGSYSGMDAAGLAGISGQLQWTDAEPEPGQIQVAAAGDDDYTFIYKNPRGAVYTAIRQDGEVTFTDPKGAKL